MNAVGDVDLENNCWTAAWGTTPVRFDPNIILSFKKAKINFGLPSLTFRTHLTPTLSGEKIRIKFSNIFGKKDLTINAATVAKGFKDSQTKIIKSSLKDITFSGSKSVTIKAGESVFSDPVEIKITALEPIVISSFVKKSGMMRTFGMIGGHTHAQFGNLTKAPDMLGSPMKLNGDFGEYAIIPMITDIDVLRDDASAAVFIGDSTIANEIPYLISRKLHDNDIHNIGVIQEAVKGNRLSHNGAGNLGCCYGEAMVKRFKRDALSISNVKYIFIKVGDNDIIHPQCKSMKSSAPYISPDDMIKDYKYLIDKAHAHGIKVFLFTRTPWRGYTRNILHKGDDVKWTYGIDEMRKKINRWILSPECTADGCCDLNYLCTDSLLEEMKKEYTTDGIHFTVLGQKQVADNFSLKYFE